MTDAQVQQRACGYILHVINVHLFLDATDMVHLKWAPFPEEFDVCGLMSWGKIVLVCVYRELYQVSTMDTMQLSDCQTLLQVNINPTICV